MKTPNTHKMFIQLDALFDTRLGALSLTKKVRITKILRGNRWHKRRFKDLHDLDIDPSIVEEYMDIYRNRDKLVLKASPVSNIHIYIRDYIRSLIADELAPAIGKPRLTVNLFPYELTERERDLMRTLLISNTRIADLDLVYKPTEEIASVSGLRGIDFLILYDYEDFLEGLAKDERIYKIPVTNKVLIIPDLLEKEPEDGLSDEEVIKQAEEYISAVIRTSLLPVGWFSSFIGITDAKRRP